ncbi:hypothetical protein DUQ17_22495 [Salmonella enterica subsp. diarizonae]|nr:hypothetical protein [Salmonella enterica subsp. diarizonae]EEI3023655.1 hypothetical protein [Salmonella enterica subsp. diarizonae]
MEDRTGNVMVPGKTGTGKTAISVEVVQTFLSARQRHDWLTLREAIQNNEETPGDGHHDNQQ